MGRRRRSDSSDLVTIYWRDIPAQVSTTHAGEKAKVLLDPRFQHAIDRAATVAGLTDTHDYVNEWRRKAEPLTGEPGSAAQRRVDDLHASYDRDRLEAIVANGGIDPETKDLS